MNCKLVKFYFTLATIMVNNALSMYNATDLHGLLLTKNRH